MKFAHIAREGATVVIVAYIVSLCLHALEAHKPQVKTLAVGDQFPENPAVRRSPRFLLIAVSANCKYSRDSRDFHKGLAEAARVKGIPSIVVEERSSVPASAGGSPTWFGIPTTSAPLASLGIDSTPTILLVENGRVRGRWTGQLSASQEQVVTSRLDPSLHTIKKLRNEDGSFSDVFELPDAAIPLTLAGAQVLDLQERGNGAGSELPKALRIPEDELPARVEIELPDYGSRVVLDCSVIKEAECVGNARLLSHMGFKDIWVFDAGILGSSCASTPVGSPR